MFSKMTKGLLTALTAIWKMKKARNWEKVFQQLAEKDMGLNPN